MQQQGDVFLYQATDDGEINVADGVAEMSGGLETSAYLALFGGNETDDTTDDSALSWWGNLSEVETCNQYRSETQYLVKSLPATSVNLRRIEDAVNRDLSYFLDKNIASSVTVAVTIPALNRVKISIAIEANGVESLFEFVENWKATK